MPTITESDWITAREAATLLGVRPDRIRWLAQAGMLGSRHVPGTRPRYSAEDVARLDRESIHLADRAAS